MPRLCHRVVREQPAEEMPKVDTVMLQLNCITARSSVRLQVSSTLLHPRHADACACRMLTV
jgi:hypothetical protein